MPQRVLLSAALGAVTLLVWTFVANGIFQVTARVQMGRVPNERLVYTVLKEAVVEPGGYMVNPELVPGGVFPADEPVFSIRYSGMGHEAAGRMFFVELALAFAGTILAAGLLSVSSERVLARYTHKVAFVIAIGVLLAVFSDLWDYGIGGYPAGSALVLAANDVAAWTLAGLVMAWPMKPRGEGARGT